MSKLFQKYNLGSEQKCSSDIQFCDSNLTLKNYYQTRLNLFLLNLKYHGGDLATARIHINGMEHYQSALSQNRPILLLGLHQGIFELLHKIPSKIEGTPFFILTAPAFASPLSLFMAKGREHNGKNVVWDRKNKLIPPYTGIAFEAGIRKIITANGTLAMMADQIKTRQNQFEDQDAVTIFGKFKLPVSMNFLKFLVKKNFQILPITTNQIHDGSTAIDFHSEWQINRTMDEKNFEAIIRKELVKFMEASIMKAPEQWNWSYPQITCTLQESSPHPRRVF